MALDISLLKKQYDKLRERQRQAHIILTNSARQSVNASNSSALPVNQYLMGRSAIVSNKGRRIGPPVGAIPPVRKVIVSSKLTKTPPKQIKKSETLYWKDAESTASKRKNTITWKEHTGKDIKSDGAIDDDTVLARSPSATSSLSSISDTSGHTSSLRRSGSSSYSEDSDGNSSTSTSLCDDENLDYSSFEASPLRKPIGTSTSAGDVITEPKEEEEYKTIPSISASAHLEECIDTLKKLSTFNDPDDDNDNEECNPDKYLQKNEMEHIENLDSEIKNNINDKKEFLIMEGCCLDLLENNKTENLNENQQIDEEDSTTECDRFELNITLQPPLDYDLMTNIEEENDENTLNLKKDKEEDKRNPKVVYSSKITFTPSVPIISPISEASNFIDPNLFYPLAITSTSQLSPIADISKYLSTSTISPLRTPSSYLDYSEFTTVSSASYEDSKALKTSTNFKVNDEGVTNEYFERVNIPERPCRLDLHESISEQYNLTPPKQRSSYEDDISKRKLHRSPQVVDLNIAEMSPISSIIPPCTDITKIPPEKSPLIHRTTVEFDNESHVPSPKNDAKDDPIGNLLTDRIHFLKEKSFSLDEPQKTKQEFRPTSCPEVRTEDLISKKNDRVLKIIEENSMILHRILRKNLSLSDADSRQVKTDFIASLSAAKEESQEDTREEAQDSTNMEIHKEIAEMIPGYSLGNEVIKTQEDINSDFESLKLRKNEYIIESLNQDTKEETIIADRESGADKNKVTDNTFELLDKFKIKLSDDENSFHYSKIRKDQDEINVVKPIESLELNTFHNIASDLNNDMKSDLMTDLTTELIKDLNSDLTRDFESHSTKDLRSDLRDDLSSNLLEDVKSNLTRDLKNSLNSDSKCSMKDLRNDFRDDMTIEFKNSFLEDSTKNLMSDMKNDLSREIKSDFTGEIKSDSEKDFMRDFENDSMRSSKRDYMSGVKSGLKNTFKEESEQNQESEKLNDTAISEIGTKIKSLIENETDNKTIMKFIDDPKLEISGEIKSENNLNLLYQLKKDIDPLLTEENPEKEDPQKDDYISNIKSWLPSERDYKFNDKIKKDKLETKCEEKLFIINDETSKISTATKIDESDEPANDISITLSSIKNTIKSIDSLCQDDEESFKKFKRKTLTDSSKKETGLDRLTNTNTKAAVTTTSYYQSLKNDPQKSQLTLQITPSFCIEEIPLSLSNINILTPTSYTRHSRDYHREASPRRRRDDEREEYESRAKRDLSPSVMSKSDVLPHKTLMDFKTLDRSISNCTFNVDTKDYDGENQKDNTVTNYGASSKYSDSIWTESLHDQIKPSISDKYIHPEKLKIRHTTVTSTFYDRFLSQKKERCSKLDKSPSSPIITKAYLDTLKPPTVIDRNSKSAENSPSRIKLETELRNISTAHSLTLLSPTDTISSNKSLNRQSYVKSCDNIPARIPVNVPTNDGDFRRRID